MTPTSDHTTDSPATPAPREPLGLFDGFGVELEYMIADAASLNVAPVSDLVIQSGIAEGGESRASDESAAVPDEINSPIRYPQRGSGIHWSNELTMHVLELKTGRPARSFRGLADDFQANVSLLGASLAKHAPSRVLLPGAMHPWMDPFKEMVLWPHGYSDVFEAFSRIFDCRGHGWANLQSVHLNLPFNGDDQFGRLHAAIRLVLPILPALCASSPIMDGRWSGRRDNRLAVYAVNSSRVPAITGRIIPEPVYTAAGYQREILEPLYAAIAPLDPDGVLQDEWLNARGAIARFDRGAIEIRVMDVQECPKADLSICAAVSAVIRSLTSGEPSACDEQKLFDTERLRSILDAAIDSAESAVIGDADYLRLLGMHAGSAASVRCSAGELWGSLLDRVGGAIEGLGGDPEPVGAIVRHGSLATRIERSLGLPPSSPMSSPRVIDREAMKAVYAELAACLAHGRLFRAE